MAELPTGTVTFLFTDVEGSTRLWEEHPEAMQGALRRHDEILRDSVERHDGAAVSTMGDGIAAVFASASDAVAAVVEAQRRLGAERWDVTGPLRVRMGLNTDEGRLRAPGQYVNRPLNRCARLMALAHGGQVLVSDATAGVARGGLPPGAGLVDLGEHRLRDLSGPARVFQLVHPDLPRVFPPLRSLDVLPGNLPRQVTSFVGRDAECAALADLLRDRVLVTLIGVGGVGKTRLAVQVAAEVAPGFPGGAWLCELAPVSDPDAVWDTLAVTFGVQPFPGRGVDESVLEYLGPKRIVMVLDNCEHLLDGVARVVSVVTQRCPQVVMLATSREALAVAGEQIVTVPSLDCPARNGAWEELESSSAVRLFVDRAQEATRDFVLNEHSAAAVAQLCRRLDGIPLAIELAAARVRTLSPQELVARLDQRFKLLTRGSRAALERHQTLRNTIDWSYDLLGPRERAALNRLSVFAGSYDLGAAEAVLADSALEPADVADMLSDLADKSLVLVEQDASGGSCYRLLDTIRQYAQERLEDSGDAPAVRRLHAHHYVERAKAAGPRLRSRDQIGCAEELARDTDNFRAALDWALETASPDHALPMVAALAVNGVSIGCAAWDWAEEATRIPGATTHRQFPAVAAWAAWGATMRLDFEHAAAYAASAEAAEAAQGTRDPAVCQGAATLALFQGDLDLARHHAQEWVSRARATGDAYDLANALTMLAPTMQGSDRAKGVSHLEEAIHVARDAGIASALSYALIALAGTLGSEDDERVAVLLDEGLDAARRGGNRMMISSAAVLLGWIAMRRADWRTAVRAAIDGAEEKLAIGDLTGMGAFYEMAAISLAHLGFLEPASVLLGARDHTPPGAMREEEEEESQAQLAPAEAVLCDGLGETAVTDLRARGAAMDHTELIALMHTEAARVLSDDRVIPSGQPGAEGPSAPAASLMATPRRLA